jgi:dsDNA-binding SOS-regulon protein
MAKSRLRGGAKAHRKRVQKRNEKMGFMKKQFETKYNKLLEEQITLLKEKMEQETAKSNDETTEEVQTTEESKSA